MIEVQRRDEFTFVVTVEEGGSTSEHTVTVDDDYYETLTGGEISKEELVRRSFEFLLEREPKESILSRFKLQVINRYFPSYEDEIGV
ncbi:MAG: hypothetical protein U9R79_17095 [Armatimonadota bacterium]|nr:hypothetical protein [Armatimonadota bacterium]